MGLDENLEVSTGVRPLYRSDTTSELEKSLEVGAGSPTPRVGSGLDVQQNLDLGLDIDRSWRHRIQDLRVEMLRGNVSIGMLYVSRASVNLYGQYTLETSVYQSAGACRIDRLRLIDSAERKILCEVPSGVELRPRQAMNFHLTTQAPRPV